MVPFLPNVYGTLKWLYILCTTVLYAKICILCMRDALYELHFMNVLKKGYRSYELLTLFLQFSSFLILNIHLK